MAISVGKMSQDQYCYIAQSILNISFGVKLCGC